MQGVGTAEAVGQGPDGPEPATQESKEDGISRAGEL